MCALLVKEIIGDGSVIILMLHVMYVNRMLMNKTLEVTNIITLY